MKKVLILIFELTRKDFREYLFEKPFTWRKFWCRLKGHPCGVWWYNVNGFEPDMRCKNCDDDLG